MIFPTITNTTRMDSNENEVDDIPKNSKQ
jgi:hypothetical protein